MTEFFEKLLHLFKNLGEPSAWGDMAALLGTFNLYVLLFAIIFAETGLVILPFLPGDSLLFALGAIGSQPEFVEKTGFNLWLITGLLIVAAILGDAVNYWIGHKVGPAIFSRGDDPTRPKRFTDKLLNRKHLLRAQEFYEKYGGKTIILARFVPVVRTFAPFVAGIGKMSYARFALYNVVGAFLWVGICVLAGVFFGQMEIVKKNFELVILGIIAISVLPMVIEFIRAKQAAKAGGSSVVEATTIGRSEGPQ